MIDKPLQETQYIISIGVLPIWLALNIVRVNNESDVKFVSYDKG